MFVTFYYSEGVHWDEQKLININSLSQQDLHLLHKWILFPIYLSDFSKWGIKLKVFSGTLKRYKKF